MVGATFFWGAKMVEIHHVRASGYSGCGKRIRTSMTCVTDRRPAVERSRIERHPWESNPPAPVTGRRLNRPVPRPCGGSDKMAGHLGIEPSMLSFGDRAAPSA